MVDVTKVDCLRIVDPNDGSWQAIITKSGFTSPQRYIVVTEDGASNVLYVQHMSAESISERFGIDIKLHLP